jgi:hypothetical protein
VVRKKPVNVGSDRKRGNHPVLGTRKCAIAAGELDRGGQVTPFGERDSQAGGERITGAGRVDDLGLGQRRILRSL